jgi:transcriptional regulator with XRE-family HTH domain
VPRKGRFVPPIDEKAIARKLREVRDRRGKTQIEVARQLGISQSLYSEYERADLRMHAGLVAALAKVLRASADELLCLKAPKGNGVPHDRRFLRRLEKMQKLSKTDKQALIKTIDAFLSKVS